MVKKQHKRASSLLWVYLLFDGEAWVAAYARVLLLLRQKCKMSMSYVTYRLFGSIVSMRRLQPDYQISNLRIVCERRFGFINQP